MEVPGNLDINRNNELPKEGQVASQDILEYTNSLTVTRNLIPDVVTCSECEAEVAVFRYREEDGWRCERCAPAMRACKNQDCTYIDTDRKRVKHEWYFCQQRTTCFICQVDVSRGMLSAHYDSVHQDITRKAGSTWRVIQGWRHRLVSSVAGTAVCGYILNDTRFRLDVRIPVSSERLREFRCEVQLTHPITRHIQTYTPVVEYDARRDWHIRVKKQDLPRWGREFDVIVNINKIQ